VYPPFDQDAYWAHESQAAALASAPANSTSDPAERATANLILELIIEFPLVLELTVNTENSSQIILFMFAMPYPMR
jgi:hypothetical protein